MGFHHYEKLFTDTALFYFGIFSLWCLVPRPWLKRHIAVQIGFFALLGLSLWFGGVSWFEVMYLCAATLLLVAESGFPRSQWLETEDEPRNIGYIFLKRSCSNFVLLGLLYSHFFAWEVPWGLSRQNCPLWAQGAVALLAIDFKSFVFHVAQHRIPFLWKFHRVHHSSKHLNLFAVGRVHFLDFAVFAVLSEAVIAKLLGLSPEAVLYGYSIPDTLIASLWAHANIDFPRTKMAFWAYIVDTPNAHAIHHSKQDNRYNYGDIFVLWDVLFGTFKSPIGYRWEPDSYGLKDETSTPTIFEEQFLIQSKRG